MTLASDGKLLQLVVEKKLLIEPFNEANVQPASIDLTLDDKIKVLKNGVTVVMGTEVSENSYTIESANKFVLKPGGMVLGQIRETIGIPRNFSGQILNRSSLVRLGLSVAWASYINPGYKGQLPIIIKNIGNFDLELVTGMRICQIVLTEIEPPPLVDYSERKDVKYHNEKGKLISKLHLDEEFSEYFKKNNSKNRELISKHIETHAKQKASKFIDSLTPELKKSLGI